MQSTAMARTPVVLLVLSCLSAVVLACGAAGIRMELTHVDSRGSYTAAERVRRAAAVSRERLASMDASASAAGRVGGGGVSAPVHWATRQYIAEYLVGSPPQRAEAIIDTGSDLVWTQCTTCIRKVCAAQDLPYFNASRSSTFAAVPCRGGGGGGTNRYCAANDVHFCALDGSCSILATYGAGGIIGALATEDFTFQSGAARLAFGCVSFAQLTPGSLHGASGLIGLGRGRLSLVAQTGATKFSYCLTPYFHNNGATSHLFVGAAATLSAAAGGPVTSMPFVESPKDFPYSSFYYLPLLGITVGEAKLPIPSSLFDLREVEPGFWLGGVIIDSGSPLTSLQGKAYRALSDELTRQLNASLVPPPGDDDIGVELCVPRGAVGKVVPSLVLHFGGGADMVLPPESYWAPVSKSTSCLVILEGGSRTIIGNYQQQNLHVLYDVGGGQFSFQRADCSKL